LFPENSSARDEIPRRPAWKEAKAEVREAGVVGRHFPHYSAQEAHSILINRALALGVDELTIIVIYRLTRNYVFGGKITSR